MVSDIAKRGGIVHDLEGQKFLDGLVQLGTIVGPVYDQAHETVLVRIKFWRERSGMTVEDLGNACRRMIEPAVLAKCNFVNSFLALLADAVNDAMAERHQREQREAEAKRRQAEEAERLAIQREREAHPEKFDLAALLGGEFFSMVGTKKGQQNRNGN